MCTTIEPRQHSKFDMPMHAVHTLHFFVVLDARRFFIIKQYSYVETFKPKRYIMKAHFFTLFNYMLATELCSGMHLVFLLNFE